jgi:transposase
MAILRAIVGGERDAAKLAKLRDPRCSKTEQEIAEQLTGHWREDHLFSLQQALQMYDAVQERIAAYEKEILRNSGTWNGNSSGDKRRRLYRMPTRQRRSKNAGRSRSGRRYTE